MVLEEGYDTPLWDQNVTSKDEWIHIRRTYYPNHETRVSTYNTNHDTRVSNHETSVSAQITKKRKVQSTLNTKHD